MIQLNSKQYVNNIEKSAKAEIPIVSFVANVKKNVWNNFRNNVYKHLINHTELI
jgi:hypothetical protein